jgi:hypothetical protein
MFCAPLIVFGCTEGVGSLYHVLRSRTHFRRYEGVRSLFHVLRFRTRFRRYRGRRIPFSCFARPDSFSAVPRASDPVFMFCAPGLIFISAECVGSCFHVWRSRTRFRRYRGRRVPFSCFARSDSFSAVPRASGPVFMFYAPGLVFDDTVGIRSVFHVLHSQTHFRRYRGSRVPFSCFTLHNSFSTVPTASGPVFMYCAPGLVFGSTEGVGSHFYV